MRFSPPSNIAAAKEPPDAELDKLDETISKTEDKPAILSIIPKHCDQYVINHSVVSTPLSSLFQEQYVCLLFDALLPEWVLAFTTLTLTKNKYETLNYPLEDKHYPKIGFVLGQAVSQLLA